MTTRSRRKAGGNRTARGIWRDHGLSITLAVLFLGAWTLQTWTGWVEFVANQAALGQPAEAFGDAGYVWAWAQATFENWQSESSRSSSSSC